MAECRSWRLQKTYISPGVLAEQGSRAKEWNGLLKISGAFLHLAVFFPSSYIPHVTEIDR